MNAEYSASHEKKKTKETVNNIARQNKVKMGGYETFTL